MFQEKNSSNKEQEEVGKGGTERDEEPEEHGSHRAGESVPAENHRSENQR